MSARFYADTRSKFNFDSGTLAGRQERGRTKAKVVTRLGWITIGNNNKEAAALRRTLKAAALKLGASRGNQPGHLRGRESGNIYCTTDVSVIGTRRISTAQHTHVNTPLHGAITLLWCAPAGRRRRATVICNPK